MTTKPDRTVNGQPSSDQGVSIPRYLFLPICWAIACTEPSAAATRAGLMPQGAWNLRVLNSTTFDKTGPTPYPKNEKDWPGVGIIRVFDFMTQNRQYFGPQRQANQGAVVFAGDSNIGEWKTLKDDFAPLGVANVGYRWRCHPRPFCSA